jgi:hypothetical protein
MHFSPKLKKRILLLFTLPALFLLVGVGLLYFVVVHRFKDSIKFIVNRESKGMYAFDAGEANLSLWNKSIQLKESVLYSPDTVNADASYRVKIHEIYFSLASWKDLLYHKKIIADSLSIIEPDFTIQVRKIKERKEPSNFRPSDILDHLERALTHFNVHSFTLKDASFTYKGPDGAPPLHGDHINLAVTNFTKVNNEDSHLLGSDKVTLFLGPQHWIFPATKHEISFNRLSFDSKGQRFELDSFSFYQRAAVDKGEVRIRADKFFFNSEHLPAIYQKGELLLDTLICVNPILTVVNNGREEKVKDSLQKIGLTDNLFKLIKVNFVSVIDGTLSLQKDGRTENTAARKANMSIFNLVVNPDKDPSIHTDSIRINLKRIEFITKDSLFRLGIDEFSIRRNDVLFRNVVFEPTSFNRSDKGVMFTAPSLLLKDISIADLLQKRLKSSGAELYRPLIVLYEKRKSATPVIQPAPKISAGKIALFYQTLHEMSELIKTPDFNITEGTVRYKLTGTKPLELNVNRLNAHILLNQLFVSDSLVDIKHAIPDLRIGELNLASKGLQINLLDFRFDGVRRNSWGRQLQVSTANGMEINGSGIYWNVFDWDIYQRTSGIQIDSLHADELTVQTRGSATRPRQPAPPKDLPGIRIGKLTVGKMLFDNNAENSSLHFSAGDLNAADIQSIKSFFTWGNARINVSSMKMDGKNRKVHINEVAFDNNKETIFKGLQFESENGQGSINLSIPIIRVKVDLHSSDLSQLSVPSLLTDNVAFYYTKRSEKDTLTVKARIKLQARNINTFKDPAKGIQVGDVNIDGRNITLNKGKIDLELPESTIHLSGGQVAKNKADLWSLSSTLDLTWKGAHLLYKKDSTDLSANHLSGSFNDPAFTLTLPAKISWQQLATRTTVSEGELHYKGKKITVEGAGCSWSPSGNILHLKNFSVLPNESREETFKKASWQGDYITVKGGSLELSGIRIDHSPRDSSIHVNKLILDGVAIHASRDKNMPFRHGIEKPMPTKLIDAIPFPLRADSVLLYNSSVVYNERSIATKKWSRIPFENLNGIILNVSNRANQLDTLRIFATAELFNSRIRHFSYEESYGDPLSAFTVRSRLSPIDLTGFSQVSIPMAAVSVTNGHADTLYSIWEGNKYAATGTLNFYYDHLKVRVLDKEDIQKRSLGPVLKTWVANLLLPDSRKKASAIFVERDQEKFVFNYWVKAISSGALTTVGVKRNKVYRKKYLKKYKLYSLPEKGMDGWR